MADDPNSTSDTPAQLPRSLGAVTSAEQIEPLEPGDQATGVVAMVRLAAVLIDPDGRIAWWSRGAEELFGHRTEAVQGRPAGGLLPAVEPRSLADSPISAGRRCDAFDTLDDLTAGGAWAGLMPVTDREDRSRSVLWWAYPLLEPDGRSLLALAADARPLRTRGPRIAIGRRLLPYAAAEAGQGGFHWISAALGHGGPAGAAGALAPLLPRIGAARQRGLLRQVAAAGGPALWVDAGTRLPVVPYEPTAAGVAALAAGIGRRYPTAQQRATAAGGGSGLRVVPEPRPAATPTAPAAAPAAPTAGPTPTPTPATAEDATPTLPGPRTAGPGPAPTPGAPLTTEQPAGPVRSAPSRPRTARSARCPTS
ncbi:PAS domain-containing protein [Kitasatospora azatica]|uniref:PAS domain-containing protein n=1 Tax=Kitasatospora azatica TaxID=58347 RepID=UPI0007C811F5|nr:PAS domain-containing protein [Kitasatospora azatica]